MKSEDWTGNEEVSAPIACSQPPGEFMNICSARNLILYCRFVASVNFLPPVSRKQ